MTPDREQIRRDAALWTEAPIEVRKAAGWQAEAFAQHCLALLSELEQAEQNEAAAVIALWTICDIGEARDVEVAREALVRLGKTR